MFCMHCDSEIKQGNIYCPACGNPLQKTYESVSTQRPNFITPPPRKIDIAF